jgi:hypothetical protein
VSSVALPSVPSKVSIKNEKENISSTANSRPPHHAKSATMGAIIAPAASNVVPTALVGAPLPNVRSSTDALRSSVTSLVSAASSSTPRAPSSVPAVAAPEAPLSMATVAASLAQQGTTAAAGAAATAIAPSTSASAPVKTDLISAFLDQEQLATDARMKLGVCSNFDRSPLKLSLTSDRDCRKRNWLLCC